MLLSDPYHSTFCICAMLICLMYRSTSYSFFFLSFDLARGRGLHGYQNFDIFVMLDAKAYRYRVISMSIILGDIFYS